MLQTTKIAFKEWAVAVESLMQGETILLLRKGGIREAGKQFSVLDREILLYPTYEHQKPELLKPHYRSSVYPVPSGWHPEQVKIQGWAKITEILTIQAEELAERLLPYHIWNQDFVRDRLKWKPQTPLHLLLLRTYRLMQPQMIPYRLEYGGCKSWIQLEQEFVLEEFQPALKEDEYQQKVLEIKSILQS